MFSSFFDLAFLNESAVETFLRNCSFCTLFISMMFYWIQTAFSSPKNVAVGYLSKFADFGTMTMILSNLLLVCLLIVRWKESGHFPLSNLYESLMFLSWSCTVIHLVLERIVKTTPTGVAAGFPPTEGKTAKLNANLFTKLIGSITSPSALFTNAFATFSLPIEMQKASPLVPALQSNWLMMHVTVMIVSYSALILGSLLAIAFLILISFNSRDEFPPLARRVKEREVILTSPEGTPLSMLSMEPSFLSMEGKEQKAILASTSDRAGALLFSTTKNSLKDTLAWNFDNLSYRILGIGFPFLTIGILSGAVWANEAWGSYWSWDPKETWALLTWLIFAIYLHARITKGWQGKKPAIIASFGFLAIWICFLGVNLIGEGLHSYGWFSLS